MAREVRRSLGTSSPGESDRPIPIIGVPSVGSKAEYIGIRSRGIYYGV